MAIPTIALAHGHGGGYYQHNNRHYDNNSNTGFWVALGVIAVVAIATANNNQPQYQPQPVIIGQGYAPHNSVATVQLDSGEFADIQYLNGRTERVYGPCRAFNVTSYTIYK